MSRTVVQPYLFFGGRCEEALDFYKSALGAEVLFSMKFSDSPDPHPENMVPPGFENKIMHVSFRVGGSDLMASDGCDPEPKFVGFRLSISLPSKGEAEKAFAALAEGGSVQMPLGQTFWSPCFGMVTDKFGIGWMVTIPSPDAPG